MHTDLLYFIEEIGKADLSIFEVESIQALLQFKWQQYGRSFFVPQLILMLIFIASYVTDVVYLNHRGLAEPNQPVFITTRAICGFTILLLTIYEILQFKFTRKENLLQYMLDYFNLNDMVLILTYVAYLVLTFLPGEKNYDCKAAIKCLQCLIVLLAFLKTYRLLKLFSSVSFLVQMLISVFADLFYFIMVFAIIIGGFTVLLEIVLQSFDEAA